MKVTLFLAPLWLFIASLFSPAENAILTGQVKDSSGEPLIGATVTIKNERTAVKGTRTDINGKYRMELEPGQYQVEFSYTGFASQRIVDVKLEPGKENVLNVTLESSTVMEEVVVTALPENKAREAGALGAAPAGKSARVTDTRSAAERKEKPAPVMMKTVAKAGELAAPKPSTAPSTEDKDSKGLAGKMRKAPVKGMDDGKPVSKGEVLDSEDFELRSDEAEPAATGTPTQPSPRAGLLTAGEWNDLQNWNHHWVDLLADGEIDAYEKLYSIYPKQRFTVFLTNENDFPIADVVTQLKTAEGAILWEARTDNTGKAELWAAIFRPEKETAKLHAELWINGIKHEIDKLKSASEGFNYLKVNVECNAPNNVDIVWAVDATGSMGDEIEYLKTELLDVIGRAKSRNPKLQYRMGTVFYRDKGDEYITKSSALSPDIASTVNFIQQQFAGGGGDYPEAVHSALEEAIFSQKWSENAVARICFLVLDASPHQEPEVIASIQKSIREAARLGIRIVPVTASGIQKDTEFLMKFFGLATNGSYVFLTDHSGIGGKHLEPTTDEYKVEPLNELLVRLITEYTSIETCEGKSEIRFENDPQQQPGPVLHALYYPNPAVDQFTLELPFEVQSVSIYNSEGKSVRKIEKPVAGPNVVLINDLSAGFYTIRILNNGLMQSGKLMVVRS